MAATDHAQFVCESSEQASNAGEPEAAAARTIAGGDLVVTHSNLHLAPGDRGMAVADSWRLDGSRIVEHWDVIQEVPEEAADANTMF